MRGMKNEMRKGIYVVLNLSLLVSVVLVGCESNNVSTSESDNNNTGKG